MNLTSFNVSISQSMLPGAQNAANNAKRPEVNWTTGQTITAIFESLEPLDQHTARFFQPDIPDNAAHTSSPMDNPRESAALARKRLTVLSTKSRTRFG